VANFGIWQHIGDLGDSVKVAHKEHVRQSGDEAQTTCLASAAHHDASGVDLRSVPQRIHGPNSVGVQETEVGGPGCRNAFGTKTPCPWTGVHWVDIVSICLAQERSCPWVSIPKKA
jgi:hypothetical protein